MALTDPLIGRMLGDYRIIDILGRGGMARVYRGYDPKLDRYAAIKVIDSHLLNSQENEEEYRARFRREARAIAKLQHPNIVSIYQYGEVDALYYMAMVFIEGRDLGIILKEHAQRQTRLAVPQILRIIGDTASALDYAHQGGVIHRDVKPSNIMVTPEGHAVLTDFGLALSVPEGSIGNTFGSAHYIAPEQAVSSAQAVPQSDLYSLAIVLYQMLAGKVPFDDPSAMSVALKHISEAPPPLRRYVPDIPPAVEQVVMKALEKEVYKRYTDGHTLVNALEVAFAPVLEGLPDANSRLRGDSVARQPGRRVSTDELEKLAPTGASPLSDTRPTWTERVPIPPSVAKSSLLSTQSSLRAAIEATRHAEPPPKEPARGSMLPRIVALIVLLALIVGVVYMMSLREQGGPSVAETTDTSGIAFNPTIEALSNQTATAVAATLTSAAAGAAVSTDTTPSDVPPTDTQPIPTDTPAEPTQTREPTQTPTPLGQLPTPTTQIDSSAVPVVGTESDPLVLIYDAQNLTLYNRSDHTVDIRGLYFSRLNQIGGEIEFDAIDWRPVTGSSYALPSGGCYQLWLISMNAQPTPPYCHTRFGYFAAGTPRQFWLSSEPDQTFNVSIGNRVLATCPTNSGECSIPIDNP